MSLILNSLANQAERMCVTDLLDSVGVDGGLRLQDADWFTFLAALWHFTHFLSDEVMNSIQRLHRTLD